MEIPVNSLGVEAYGFVYITENLVNGKKYVGQRKLHRHSTDDDNYLGSGALIQKAIKKYGKENFQRTILEWAWDKDSLDKKEVEYITMYNAVDDPNYYNILSGGQFGLTEDVIKRRAESLCLWYANNPDKAAEKQKGATLWRQREPERAAEVTKNIIPKLCEGYKRFYEEHYDEFIKRYEKAKKSRKKFIEEHPDKEAERISKVLQAQLERTIFPIVCISRNEIYVALWHAKTIIGRTAENIKRHLDGKYKWCGKDPITGAHLHWRLATVEDFDNIPFAQGGEQYAQLCREFLQNTN